MMILETQRLIEEINAGKSATEIATVHNISRQAIYKRAEKLGLTEALYANRPKFTRKQTALEAKYGLPLDLIRRLQKERITYAFYRQRQSASTRGIGWKLTFKEWYEVWRDSGKLKLRGRQKGCYVMGRNGDEGPYAVGNVYICTLSENARVRESKRV